MNFLQPQISAELTTELRRAHELHQFIMQTYPPSFKVLSDRINLLAAKTHLADDLFGSILYLLAGGGSYDGGAFALVRPLVEASVEAQWQYFCANDKLLARAYAGELVGPGLPNMMDEVDKVLGDTIFAGLRKNVKVLHGFTHGGIEQLGRRFDVEGNLRASYKDEEKLEVIRTCGAVFTLLSSIFCQAISVGTDKAAESAAIEQKYAELYGAT